MGCPYGAATAHGQESVTEALAGGGVPARYATPHRSPKLLTRATPRSQYRGWVYSSGFRILALLL